MKFRIDGQHEFNEVSGATNSKNYKYLVHRTLCWLSVPFYYILFVK